MSDTRRLIVELEVKDHDALVAAARRRGWTLQMLAERLLTECLASEVMAALLDEDDDA
ncbi:MAG: hypothetical protein IOC42_02735 [Methylobacterium sp.]|nr:hypothetical protein [Methylobacterium sp.]MCA3668153.1 hypothetical protein [Methylobacterium sp.]MCA3674539.1 hypothetical protein [Methylobacterium sp.]MCA3702802.1 hypothetical protein [Methylobacterium sp.]